MVCPVLLLERASSEKGVLDMAERKRHRPYTKDDVRFVHENYSTMTAQQIAEERGISKFQVSKIVSELRKAGIKLPRKSVRRQNAVAQYLDEIGVKPKRKRGRPAKKR